MQSIRLFIILLYFGLINSLYAQEFEVNQDVKVLSFSENKWYEGKILKIESNKYFISYNGWGSEWNEWVTEDKLCLLKAKTTNTFIDSILLLEKGNKFKSQRSKADNLFEIGNYYKFRQPTVALKYLTLCAELSEKIKYYEGEANSYNSSGMIYRSKSNLKQALVCYTKGLEVARKNKLIGIEAFLINNMASVYHEEQNDTLALQLYNRALQKFKELKDTSSICSAWIGIGNIFLYSSTLKAIQYYDSAIYAASSAKNYNKLAYGYANIGNAYDIIHKSSLSKEYLYKSLEIRRKIKDHAGIENSIYNLLITYENEGKLDSAIHLSKEGISAAKIIQDYASLYKLYNYIARLHELKKNFDLAYSDFKLATSYLNLSNEENNRNEINNLKAEFEYDLQKAEIISLEHQKKLKDDIIDGKNKSLFMTMAFVVIISITLILLFFLYKKVKRNHQILEKQKQEIISKTNQITEQAAQIARLQTQMNPHFVFNALGAIQQFVVENNLEKTLNSLNDFSKLMRLTLHNSDKQTISLKEEFDFLSLYLKFEQLRFNNEFSFSFNIDEQLDKSTIQILPMLLQPLVENAIQHGIRSMPANGKIEVNIKPENKLNQEILIITVKDNGIGLEAAGKLRDQNIFKNQYESKAIKICEERIKVIWEKRNVPLVDFFSIHSPCSEKEKCGTEVIIKLPLIENF